MTGLACDTWKQRIGISKVSMRVTGGWISDEEEGCVGKRTLEVLKPRVNWCPGRCPARTQYLLEALCFHSAEQGLIHRVRVPSHRGKEKWCAVSYVDEAREVCNRA